MTIEQITSAVLADLFRLRGATYENAKAGADGMRKKHDPKDLGSAEFEVVAEVVPEERRLPGTSEP